MRSDVAIGGIGWLSLVLSCIARDCGVQSKCKARQAACLRHLGRLVEAAELAREAGGPLGASEAAATAAVVAGLEQAQAAVLGGEPVRDISAGGGPLSAASYLSSVELS